MEELFESFELLEKGILPDAGGWTDQCPEFIDAVRAIKGQRDDCERETKAAEERIAEIKRKATRGRG